MNNSMPGSLFGDEDYPMHEGSDGESSDASSSSGYDSPWASSKSSTISPARQVKGLSYSSSDQSSSQKSRDPPTPAYLTPSPTPERTLRVSTPSSPPSTEYEYITPPATPLPLRSRVGPPSLERNRDHSSLDRPDGGRFWTPQNSNSSKCQNSQINDKSQSHTDAVESSSSYIMLPAYLLRFLDSRIKPYAREVPTALVSAINNFSPSAISSLFGSVSGDSVAQGYVSNHDDSESAVWDQGTSQCPPGRSSESPRRVKRENITPSSSSNRKEKNKATPIYLTMDGEFQSGQQLRPYQLTDVRRLVNRELGEAVCRTNASNNIGYILAYSTGLGKTAVAIALTVLNPPEVKFEGAKATLILVSNKATPMDAWKSEIKKFAPHLDVCCYDKGAAELRPNADIVLLTYHQLRLQHLASLANPHSVNSFPIYQHKWYRIICDKAECFKNPETKLAQAMWDVKKCHALCLTDTSDQSSGVFDYYALFRFLGVEYEGINDLKTFERKVSKYQKRRPSDPRATEIPESVKESFCIFRSNQARIEGELRVDLSAYQEVLVAIALENEEKMLYKFVKRQPLQSFAKLMCLRQACVHPSLIMHGLKGDLLYADEGEEEYDFLANTLNSHTNSVNKIPTSVRKIFERGDRYRSLKLRAMVKTVKENWHRGEKTIIFTHFTNMIKPIGNALTRANISWTEYKRDMTATRQHEERNIFSRDSDKYSVVIMSIMTGGTGPNITSCNAIILLESWWDAVTEEQAISRICPIGLSRPVKIYRFIFTDSIEESISATQEAKREVAQDGYSVKLAAETQQGWLAGP